MKLKRNLLSSLVAAAWADWRAARARAGELADIVARAAAESEELALRLSELDRLDPQAGEEPALAEQRAILGASEKALADIAEAAQAFDGLSSRLAQAVRAVEQWTFEPALSNGQPVESKARRRLEFQL